MHLTNISLFPAIRPLGEDDVLEEIVPAPLPLDVSANGNGRNGEHELAITEALGADTPFGFTEGEAWQSHALDGQLAVDVYETDAAIVIVAPIAGVRPEELDITVVNDLVTIRGTRTRRDVQDTRVVVAECYWGPFSRSLILPADVRTDRVKAFLKQGVLTVILPKLRKESRVRVEEIER